MFNEADFLNSTTQGEMSTKRKLIPPNEYVAVIGEDIKARQSQGKKDPSKTYVFLDVPLKIDLPAPVAAELGRQQAIVTHSVSLDIGEGGALDLGEGKNIQLGRLRAAVGQNDASRPWKPRDLIGQMLKVTVTHEVQGEDTYERVKSIAAL